MLGVADDMHVLWSTVNMIGDNSCLTFFKSSNTFMSLWYLRFVIFRRCKMKKIYMHQVNVILENGLVDTTVINIKEAGWAVTLARPKKYLIARIEISRTTFRTWPILRNHNGQFYYTITRHGSSPYHYWTNWRHSKSGAIVKC